AYAKRSLFEGYTISDYDLEEQLAISPFTDSANWHLDLNREFGGRYTFKNQSCSEALSGVSKKWEPTEIAFLQKEASPFLIPDYRIIKDSSCLTLIPIRGGLNNRLWSTPLLEKHIYLYEKNGCWLDGKSGESCKSLADWEKLGYYMYPHNLGDQGLAVLIPKYSWADWLGVFVVFVSLILVFQGVAMFFRFKERLLASYISKFTVFQVGGILVLVAGLLVFIQFGIIRFGESQFEALKVEKTESVLLELQSKFRNGLNGDETLFAALQKFAYVFQTELVLYRPNGKFWMASFYPNVQSNIGFQIPTIHLPELPSFQGDNVRFSSSLSEVFGAWKLQDQPIGYLGVPYSKAGLRVSKGVSEMQVLVSGGVLFLVLGLVGLLLWVVRNRIEPIEQLRLQLDGWEQGKGAQILQYHREDEFGVLVKAFNRATRLLSIREKEGAWKGVAQQIAHEIKNPLTPLRLQLQLLPRKLKDLSDTEKGVVEEFVKNTLVQIDAMADMAENFSTFARLPQPKQESMTVWDSMESAVETFKSQVVFNVDQSAFSALPVFWDKSQWIRIWTNLFKNALQATDGGEAVITIDLVDTQNGFRILVSDNGKGIDPAIIPSIFEPNFTTKSGGTGLGLAMVKRMVELHHGQIGLLQSTESGTVFFMDF
ncbi:MAG: two-component system nitrogen regulation sensor histidine kinase NtrY, partial [Luteibaculaceae bacterium]